MERIEILEQLSRGEISKAEAEQLLEEGSPPIPKSWVRIPRTLMASMKLSWLLPVMPGVNDTRSLTSSRLTLLMNSPDRAVIANGTSCTDSLRLVAVTITSSSCCDHAGSAIAEAITVAETAFASVFLRGRPLDRG